jgi:hypothetical protein
VIEDKPSKPSYGLSVIFERFTRMGHIEYAPSHHPNIPSRVTVYDIIFLYNADDFDTTPDTTPVPGLVPSINKSNEINSLNKTKGKALAPKKK